MNFFKGCLYALRFVVPFWCLVIFIVLLVIFGR